jgi:hypothetical protein
MELEGAVAVAEWPFVYDIAEAIYEYLTRNDSANAVPFQENLNGYFRRAGIGWQMVDGIVQTRGPEAFERSTREARQALVESGRLTAAAEIYEALRDLSRRPDPDLTGALHHGMGALEAIVRDLTHQPTATLGQLLQRNPTLIPKPLNVAVERAWGYASQAGRHVLEGQRLNRDDVEFVVGLAALVSTYLVRRGKPTT